jgi:hypothetical protein
MHERQIEEGSQRRVDLPVVPRLDGRVRDGQRLAVGGEHVATAAPGVARKLVQQHEQRQRPFGIGGPAVERPVRGGMVGGLEARFELGVEGVVLVEPAFRAGVAPEADDILGGG